MEKDERIKKQSKLLMEEKKKVKYLKRALREKEKEFKHLISNFGDLKKDCSILYTKVENYEDVVGTLRNFLGIGDSKWNEPDE